MTEPSLTGLQEAELGMNGLFWLGELRAGIGAQVPALALPWKQPLPALGLSFPVC